jgi:hypothetical protein
MKRWLAILLAWGFTGCDNVDAGLTFVKYVRPDDDCLISPDDPSAIFYRFDPFFQGDLEVFAVLRNELEAPEQLLSDGTGLQITPATELTVTEFEYIYECDASAFAGAGQLFLPSLGASGVPFCQNPRDPGGAFQGFDVRPVDGASIDPGEIEAVGVTLITGELGRRFEEMFELAINAEVCCSGLSEDFCAQGRIDELPSNPECDEVRTAVVTNRLPVTEIENLRQFAKFDVTNPSGWIGSAYGLQVKGNYIGVTTGGRTLTSNQATLTLQLTGRDLQQQFLSGGQDVRDSLRAAFTCSSRVLF